MVNELPTSDDIEYARSKFFLLATAISYGKKEYYAHMRASGIKRARDYGIKFEEVSESPSRLAAALLATICDDFKSPSLIRELSTYEISCGVTADDAAWSVIIHVANLLNIRKWLKHKYGYAGWRSVFLSAARKLHDSLTDTPHLISEYPSPLTWDRISSMGKSAAKRYIFQGHTRVPRYVSLNDSSSDCLTMPILKSRNIPTLVSCCIPSDRKLSASDTMNLVQGLKSTGTPTEPVTSIADLGIFPSLRISKVGASGTNDYIDKLKSTLIRRISETKKVRHLFQWRVLIANLYYSDEYSIDSHSELDKLYKFKASYNWVAERILEAFRNPEGYHYSVIYIPNNNRLTVVPRNIHWVLNELKMLKRIKLLDTLVIDGIAYEMVSSLPENSKGVARIYYESEFYIFCPPLYQAVNTRNTM